MTTQPRRGAGEESPRVAVVLSGAAARGAFQAGALATLVPALAREGLRPTIWLGTSAGSINAVLWGATAHLGARAAADEVLGVWRRMGEHDVYRPLLPFSLARTGLQYVAGAVLGVGSGTTSLLDTAPLRQSAAAQLRMERLAANVDYGTLAAVGVVATRMPAATPARSPSGGSGEGAGSGRSVLFLDEHAPGAYDGDPARALDVVRGPLDADHVLASSAIPVAFPPVRVGEPEHAAGWYVDGGVRLNSPLHPAVGLGATRIVLVSATATTYGGPPPPDLAHRSPDVDDAAAQVLHAALADRTTEDLGLLRRTNRLVAQAAGVGRPDLFTARSGRPYRRIETMVVSPQPGEMGRVATEVFRRRTRGLRRLTETDSWLLGRALRGGGDAIGRRELLSYLFFDQEYFAASIELGRAAASAALARGWEH